MTALWSSAAGSSASSDARMALPRSVSPRGAAIPSEDGRGEQKFQGQTVKVKLEEAALKKIAETSKGRYVPLATAGTAETTLGAIYRRFLRQVAAKEQNEEAERAAERYQLFLIPGLALLIAGAALSKGRFARRTTQTL